LLQHNRVYIEARVSPLPPLPLHNEPQQAKHGCPDSDPPTSLPAVKRCLDGDTEEVSVLQKQIAELADKLAKQVVEISQLQEAVSNLTEAQTGNNKTLAPEARTSPTQANKQSRGDPETVKVHPPSTAKPEHILRQWTVCNPSHPLHCNTAKSQLLFDIIIPCDKQAKGQAVINQVNWHLETVEKNLRVEALLYSKKG
jgi:hypothetical protein